MLDAIFNNTTESTLSISASILTVVTAIILGIIISYTYMKTNKGVPHSQNFILTIIMVPAIIAIIILLIGSNVARAFGLAGAFSIIRFRSTPGDPKDITYIFFSMAAGLACGVGLIAYSVIFTLLLCGFMVILHIINFGKNKTSNKMLKIVIPEDLNYANIFDDILDKFTQSYELKKVRTADLGTVFELIYTITTKNEINEKEMLDEIRCRNGNLNITLSLAPECSI